MIPRPRRLAELRALASRSPVVAILGPRQVGKTTLARMAGGPDATRFDLEDPRDLARLDDPMAALAGLRGWVVIDEVQRRPELFPVLRVLADRPRRPARFLVLGSAAPSLLRQSSESLAGRISYVRLSGFDADEAGPAASRLWLRGGYPRSLLARSDADSVGWRRDFLAAYLERDLPQLGVSVPAATLRRLWTMLAHCHAQTLNSSELGRSLGVADTTVRKYLDVLCDTFMMRQLRPWHENLGKRQVKAPKLYVADTGLLHALLDIRDAAALDGHPKSGASWEGFALAQVTARLGADADECHFWRTHNGAELDLLVVRGRRRLGFEFKKSSAPTLTPSMRSALSDLRLDSLTVVYPGERGYPLGGGVTVLPLGRVWKDLEPLG